jgi:hypothetical protein
MNKYIEFTLIYLTIQNLLLIIEYDHFFTTMISDIQNRPFDGSSTLKLFLRSLILYIIVYGSMIYLFTKYIYETASYSEAFIFGSIMYIVADLGNIYGMFKKAQKYLLILLFDIFIVGGLCLTVSLYVSRNFSTIISKNALLLLVAFISSFSYFIYYSYTTTKEKLKEHVAKQQVPQ